ncbi:MAG: TIGR00725 family protein [Solirubrobacterales bacterium]
MTRTRQVAVSGGGVDPPEDALAAAEEVGRRLAEAEITVVCGGLGGVMEAAARGAARPGGEVIGILPGDDPSEANPHCTQVIATGIGHARNLAVVASGDAVIAIGGEWGTLSEIAFARQLGRPVVALDTWSMRGAGPMAEAPGVEAVPDPAAAVAAVVRATAN